MTRDEEIEKLALELTLHDLKTVDQAWPTKQEHADHRWDQNMRAAELLFTARDRYRAARQPAPETPTPRIGPMQLPERIAKTKQLLALALELGQAEPIGFDQIVVCVPSTWNERETIYRPFVREYAATLKERKEKADGA
jgi:hypothetical protein